MFVTRLRRIAARLEDAGCFVEVAGTALAEAVALFGADAGSIEACAPDGAPLVAVVTASCDAGAIDRYLARRGDAALAAVRHTQAPILRDGPEADALAGYLLRPAYRLAVLPLLGRGDLLGVMRLANGCWTAIPELTAFTTHVAVRLARAGAGAATVATMTPRQREIAELVARGCTNAEIARLLGVSPNAVKKHLKHVFDALGVGNRAELVARLSEELVIDHRRAPAGIRVHRR